MRKRKEILWQPPAGLLSVVLLFIATVLPAQSPEEAITISPFPGASQKTRYVVNFGEYILPVGQPGKNGELVKTQKLQGKIIQTTFTIPASRSVLEVYQNYRQALQEAGFDILFTFKKEEQPHWSQWADKFCSATQRDPRWEQDIKYSLHYAEEGRFIAAKLTRPGGDIYAAICLGKGGWHNYITLQQDLIELKPLETGLVKITSEMLENKIKQHGHVAIYGIYFDFNKAELKPESEPVLKEIARLLKKNPDLKLYVVGHTDNIGSLAYNRKLSRQRAEAVVQRLVNRYHISPDRLKAFGVGPLCPLASNSTEAGRAKNRRVELVEQ